MIDTRQLTLGDQVFEFETGKVGKQAGGAVTVRSGDTVIFAAATMSPTARENIDFFPLGSSCDRREHRSWALGSGWEATGTPNDQPRERNRENLADERCGRSARSIG